MNARLTFQILGGLLLSLAGVLLLPIPFALAFHDGQTWVFATSAAITASVGFALFKGISAQGELGLREGFGVVSLSWASFAVFGALPYLIGGSIPAVTDAVFEAASGFTTTGATILTRIADLPPSMLLWRSLTQWLGGMGIIVLTIAILPILKVGGMQMFRAEVPGPTKDRLTPRIQDTARLLWEVYFGLTAIEFVLLGLGEMSWFEALCHSLTTMATGGFSTSDASIAGFTSSYTHWVITVFMFLAGINFSLHYSLLRHGARDLLRSEEFRVYSGTILAATLLITLQIWDRYNDGILALRDAAFQVVSIATSTGFASADFELWPLATQSLLLGLMLMGAMAGSTGGGIKVARIIVVIKHAHQQVFRLIHPRGVRVLKLDHRAVPEDVVQSVLGFGALYFLLFALATFTLSLIGVDLLTAATGVVSALSNIGPGLGSIGPTENYAHLPGLGKWTLTVCMILGRLEIFTVLVLLVPSFWRR